MNRVTSLIILALLLSACAPAAQARPTATRPAVTATIVLPSATPLPSSATRALTITATRTLAPTDTLTPSATPSPLPSLTPTAAPVTLIGAGDIAECGNPAGAQTATLVEQYPAAAVFTAGDNAYETGSAAEFTQCYDPTWGMFKNRTHPAPGNHEYRTGGASAYFAYFGAAAGRPDEGWYSYDLGAWHIIALNSDCNDVACGPDSPQVRWLKADLAASQARCTLAYWHHPLFSSGLTTGSPWLRPFFQALYDGGAEVVVNGHDHDYERFAPQDPAGNPDPQKGIREFVVGTGGAYQRPFGKVQPNSEVRLTGEFGVILFTLYPDRYAWQFLTVDPQQAGDRGEGQCH